KPAPAPAPVHSAPAPAPMQQQQSGGMMSGLMGTVAQGMAFGTGSAIAHRAVGAVANSIGGGSDNSHQEAAPAAAAPPQEANPCVNQNKAFMDCLNANSNDVAACQFYFDQFKMCERQAQQNHY
ncbi:hypothetical protein THRCLA_23360, partial [Thraustotheca clavata]